MYSYSGMTACMSGDMTLMWTDGGGDGLWQFQPALLLSLQNSTAHVGPTMQTGLRNDKPDYKQPKD